MTRLFEARPFVIAEVGSNWRSLGDCLQSISAAKQCGADAVKFQAFTFEALYGGPESMTTPPALPLDWLSQLKEKADACGIEFMCTAFSPELLDTVDPYVTVHKIASGDLNYPQLLERAKSKGKPVILSCGAASKGEIDFALRALEGAEVVLLYCNAAYPSREHNLFRMQELKRATGKPVGLSDHSLDVIYAPLSAFKHFNAIAIEKHVNFVGCEGPDAPHSLSSDQFKLMCDYLRGQRDYVEFNPTSEEKPMLLRHKRRLIAMKNLEPGDVLKFGENYGAYRTLEDDSRGLSPFFWESLEGQVVGRAISAGKGITVTDLK